MSEGANETDTAVRTRELLGSGAAAELRLLRQERKAEKRLADALETLVSEEARLQKAQQRLERSREAVASAENALREAQARRAAGSAAPEH